MKQSIFTLLFALVFSTTASAQEFLHIYGQPDPDNASKYINSNIVFVDDIDSITYSERVLPMLPELMAGDKSISLFCEALEVTGLADSLRFYYYDENYGTLSDSCEWANDRLVFHVATEYDNVAYPSIRYFKRTVFAEPNEVFEKHGVTDLEGLKRLAKSIYDEVYPEDAHITDPTDRRNSLNRFVAYHILNFPASYYQLTAVDGPNSTLAKNFDRTVLDIADWYETMMPHSLLKCSFPSGSAEGLYVNRRGVEDHADARGVLVRGAKVATPSEYTTSQTERNGIYHYIDDIIAYGKETQEVVLNERLRIDATTLSPDFMTQGPDGQPARGHYTRSSIENGKYGRYETTVSAAENTRLSVGFKPGFIENFAFKRVFLPDTTTYDNYDAHVHVRPRTLSFWSYQGDELVIKANNEHDIMDIKLPSLPAGEYELRLATPVGFTDNSVLKFYINGEAKGDSVDFRQTSYALGWRSADAEPGWDERELTNEGGVIYNIVHNTMLVEKDFDNGEWGYEDRVTGNTYYEVEVHTADEWYFYYEDRVHGTRLSNGDINALYNTYTKQAYRQYFNQVFKDNGFKRGPASYYPANSESGDRGEYNFRELSNCLRYVVGSFTTDGKSDNYLRVQWTYPKDIGWGRPLTLTLDYIELVPKSVLSNEDIY